MRRHDCTRQPARLARGNAHGAVQPLQPFFIAYWSRLPLLSPVACELERLGLCAVGAAFFAEKFSVMLPALLLYLKTRSLVFQRLRESCFGASCPNSTPPAAVDQELDVAACAEEPRQLSDSLADAVHTTALKRRLSFRLLSTCGQDMQGGKAQARLRLNSTSRLCRASSTGIALSGICPSGDNPPYEPAAQGIKRKIKPRPSGRKEARAEPNI